MNSRKKTRARSPEKKSENFKKITEIGKSQLAKHTARGLSLRSIAKEMNMRQNNIYNYVKSKKELWIIIRSSYYNEFLVPFDRIIKEHQGTYTELLIKFSEFFLEFASEDYNRFEVMFLISAPPSKIIGPYERAYEPFQITKRVLSLVKKAIEVGEIKEKDAIKLHYQIFAILIGAAKMEADLKDHFKITEPLEIRSYIGTQDEYRKFVLKSIKKMLEENMTTNK